MVFAHGIGGAKDLPVPAVYAMAGAGAALAVSFIVLALAWRTPRFDAATHGRPVPARLAAVVDSTTLAVLLRVAGLLFFGYVAWAAVLGPDLLTNPTFGVVYVLLWVGLVPLSLLFGPFYRAVSPVRTIQLLLTRLTGGSPDEGLFTLPRLGRLLARPVGLFAFVWLELVYPDSTYLSPVRLWFAVYLAVMVVGGALFGTGGSPAPTRSRCTPPWSAISRCSAGRADGTLVLRSPLGQPRRRAGPARAGRRWSRCCSAAPRSTASRTPPSG